MMTVLTQHYGKQGSPVQLAAAPDGEVGFSDGFAYEGGDPVSVTDLIYRYTGQMFDTAAGPENNLARWYDPTVGRWLSQDPLGLGPDANPYRYVGNNPLMHTDPSGLKEQDF